MRTFSLATNGCLVGQKAIVFMVIFSLFLNALMPKFVMEYRVSSDMSQVIENQAVLFTQLNSLTSMAVKIAGAFLKNGVTRAAIPFSKAKKSGTNTSSEYSLISTEKRLFSLTVYDHVEPAVARIWLVVSQPAVGAIERAYLDGSMRGIYVGLVLCLFSLARSDVYDVVKRIMDYTWNPTCVGKLGFLFEYGQKTTLGQGN